MCGVMGGGVDTTDCVDSLDSLHRYIDTSDFVGTVDNLDIV